MRNAFTVRHLCMLAVAAALSGCAGWRDKLNPSPTVTQTREERAADAVRDFEDRRDAAQLAAAIERIEQGDMPRAETMLESIVKRRPTCVPARLRLAEILWLRNDVAAETHLRAALEADASHAEAHHTLGLVLDATGRTDEARRHFTRATQIEPENEVYRVTAESLPNGTATAALASQTR